MKRNTSKTGASTSLKKPKRVTPEEHSGTGLRNTLHGNIYQLKLLMLFFYRALQNGYSFRLATEFEPGEKFDDLFLEYENETGDGNIYRFVQAKHKQDDNDTITFKDLITEADGEFSLQKYFRSYLKIIQNPELRKPTSEFKDFVICTNIDLHTTLHDNFETIKEADPILDIHMSNAQRMPKRLKFKSGNFFYKDKILLNLKNTTDSKRLANKLVEIDNLNLKDDLFQLYHGPLVREVFEVVTDKKTKEFYSRFKGSFLNESDNNNCSDELISLKKHFFTYYNLKKNKLTLEEFKKKKIDTSPNFGKVFQLVDNPAIINLDAFVEEIANEIEAENNLQSNIVTIKRQKNIINQNIEKLAGHLLIKKCDDDKGPFYFSDAFFDDNIQLSSDLSKFRTGLKSSLDKKKVDFKKDDFKFKINNFLTCEEGKQHLKMNLPKDFFDDNDIKGFLDKLVFAVNQPNENELGKLIEDEMAENESINLLDNDLIASKFQIYMLDWMKKKQGTFLTYEEGQQFLIEAINKFSKLMLIGPTLEYRAIMDDFGIYFRNNVIDEMQSLTDFLSPVTDKQIFNVITEHIQLSSVKVYKIIMSLPEYKKDDSFIFLRLSSLLHLQERVLNAFHTQNNNLLIIECENEKIKKLVDLLLKIIRKCSNIKIILITEKCLTRNTIKMIKLNKGKFEKLIDRKMQFADLLTKSQKMLLDKRLVKFQGHEVNLGKLVKNSTVASAINSDILFILLCNKTQIEIGKRLSDLGETGLYYIERAFNRPIQNPDDFIQEASKHFLISNNKENFDKLIEKNNDRKIIVMSDNDNLFNIINNSHIHCIKRNGNELRHVRYFKYGSSFSKIFGEDENQILTTIKIQPKLITDIEDKIVIIADEPGMGKSTLLTYLAAKTKEHDPLTWVVRINLVDHSRQFKEWGNDEITKEIAEKFIYETQKEINDSILSLFKEQIFYNFYNQGKVVLLFDGFDEINPHYKEQVMKLLLVFKSSKIKKLWLTTRPYGIKNEIENKLGTFSFSMEPFSKEEQIKFLEEYLKKNININVLNDRADKYIEELCLWLSSSTNDKGQTFSKIPLHLKMIAEVYEQEFIKFSNTNFNERPTVKYNLYSLYDSFIDTKFRKIRYCQKQDLDDSKPDVINLIEIGQKDFMKNHKILALHALYGQDLLKTLLDVNDLINEIKAGKEKTGIIDRVVDNKPIFVHQSYAEYFAALWFADNWLKPEVKQFLRENIFGEENEVIRMFFDYKMAENEFHVAILNNDPNKVREILKINEDEISTVINSLDKGGRSGLHLVAAYSYEEIGKILLAPKFKDIIQLEINDDIFDCNSIQYAVKQSSWELAEALINRGVKYPEIFDDLKSIKIDREKIYANSNVEQSLLERLRGCKTLAGILIQKHMKFNSI